jgi:glycosyltransferase involved in cell wall biosynthesis
MGVKTSTTTETQESPASFQKAWNGHAERPSPTVLAVAHSLYGRERAEQLLDGLFDARVVFTGGGARGARRATRAVLASQAPVVYLVDVGVSTTVGAVLARALRRRVVLDTGDVAYELARSVGGRSAASLALVRVGEQAALRASHQVVVRGRRHAELVPRPATHIPDLAPTGVGPEPGDPVRQALGLDDAFVVGMVGSIRRAPRLGITYGWDLVEALAWTPARVHGLIVGDGDGLGELQQRARTLGVLSRCHFVGRVRSAQVAAFIAAMDVGISTQSNDIVGAVRTTGKLPLYLACHRPVLASHVGEAIDLLAPLGWTVPYEGVVDPMYPRRLAEKIEGWAADPEKMALRRGDAGELSRRVFDPVVLRGRLATVIEHLLQDV